MITYPGHGAKSRPAHLKTKDKLYAGAVTPFDWSQIKEDSIGPVPNLFGLFDRDQDGSGSCTCQATAYEFFYCTKIEINRKELYSHVYLSGGGAYLNAPLDFLRNTGPILLSKYPDPNPETEQAMTTIIAVQAGDRIRTFKLSYTYYGTDIDSAALAITNHNYIHLGVKGSWIKGWEKSWIDPYFSQEDWDHALFAGKESLVLRNGIPTIKAKSSWCQHFDPEGKQVFCHYLNKSYFDAYGVFEIIAVDIAELELMTSVDVTKMYVLAFYRAPTPDELNYWSGKPLLDFLNTAIKDRP